MSPAQQAAAERSDRTAGVTDAPHDQAQGEDQMADNGRMPGDDQLPDGAGERAAPVPDPAARDAVGDARQSGLSARLMALARMIQIGTARSGRGGVSKKLLADAESVLARAGDRMRLSSSHTVVALAGGTGSGKSSLFNRLAGAEFSTVGVTRPVTKDAHACTWGPAGSGTLLEWLRVPARYRYARESALDHGEADLTGLVLLDLPDHDSVMSHAADLVDRLVSQADVVIWVLDPQKYADAAVHRRFLIPMASHADVFAVVLNQADLLDAAQLDDCVGDLRRLLDAEDLQEVPILVTSAVTGAGIGELRSALVEAVAAGRSAVARISADVDEVVARFATYAGDLTDDRPELGAQEKEPVVASFVSAAGVAAIGDSLASARELRAADFVGWPVAWLVQRLSGRDPRRKQRVGMLWNELRQITAGPSGAQQAEIDNALTELGDHLAGPLPRPWGQTVRAALRARSDVIPSAIGEALDEELPSPDTTLWWWRIAGLWQGLLLGVTFVALVWMVLTVIFGSLHVSASPSPVISDTAALPWFGVAVVVALGLGAASAALSMALVSKQAERERSLVQARVRDRIAAIAEGHAFLSAGQELSELDRFREETRIAVRGSASSHT